MIRFSKFFPKGWLFTIRIKLAIVITLLIGMISLFIFIYFPFRLEKQAIKAIVAKAQSIAEMTAFSISSALFFEDIDTMEAILKSARQNKDLVYILVFNDAGNVTAAFNQDKADEVNFIQARDHNHISQTGTIYKVMTSILLNDREIGQLYLGLSLEEVREEIGRSRANIALVSFMIFVIGMIAVFGISTVITRPLGHMVETFGQISAGNLRQRATVSSKSEVGHLARSFNVMVDNLESVYSELEDLNQVLEKRVEERTEELRREIDERKRVEERIKASLREKEILLKEIHHRVKNNLQIISSLLNLQSEYIKDKQALVVFKESQNRVRSMALIHERLYQSEDLSRIEFGEYLRNLANHLFRSYGVNSNTIELKIRVDDASLGIDAAIPCGLIMNELISNSLKYAFSERKEGEICIDFGSDNDGTFILTVSDNGVGFPEDLDFRSTGSLGLQLVRMLTEQFNGTIELDRSSGTKFKIKFTESEWKGRK